MISILMANFVWQSSVWRCRIIESTGRIDMTFADLHFSKPLSRRHIEQKSSRQRSFSLVRTKALRIDESARRDIRIFYENGLFHRSDGLPSSLLSSGHVVQFSPTQAFQLLSSDQDNAGLVTGRCAVSLLKKCYESF